MHKEITVHQLKEKIDKNKKFILLDVRTRYEYDEGHLKNAKLIPYTELQENHALLEASKDDEIVVYCRTNNRSPVAARILSELGYKKVSKVNGGIIEWSLNGFPVEKQ